MNLNTTKLEELLATLKKKEEEKDKNTVLWYWRSSVRLQLLQESHLQYTVSSLRIIWRISKKILMMTSMIILRTRKSKIFHRNSCFEQIRMVVCSVWIWEADDWSPGAIPGLDFWMQAVKRLCLRADRKANLEYSIYCLLLIRQKEDLWKKVKFTKVL